MLISRVLQTRAVGAIGAVLAIVAVSAVGTERSDKLVLAVLIPIARTQPKGTSDRDQLTSLCNRCSRHSWNNCRSLVILPNANGSVSKLDRIHTCYVWNVCVKG